METAAVKRMLHSQPSAAFIDVVDTVKPVSTLDDY